MRETPLSDFPKIECPFIRKVFPIDPEDFKKQGRRLQLRRPEVQLVVDEVNPGFEWVFDDPETIATEKLDGTNIKLKTEHGRLVALQNRLNVIDPLQIIKGKTFLIEGIFMAIQKDYVKPDGVQAGEVIGPKLQGTPINWKRISGIPLNGSANISPIHPGINTNGPSTISLPGSKII